MKYIFANWKANKTLQEALDWLNEFSQSFSRKERIEKVEAVICPSFVVLPELKKQLTQLELPFSLKLGAQTVSAYESGPYTGQVTAEMLAGLVDYCLVGHSETRAEIGATNEKISAMLKLLQKYQIKPVLLASKISQIEDVRPALTGFTKDGYALCFEPTEAISKGGAYKAYSPQTLQQALVRWKNELKLACSLLYGGSVNPDNASSLLEQTNIDGFIVGKASLAAREFAQIIKNASKI